MTIHTSPSNVTLDRQAARAAIIAAAGRFTALLREIDHIERPAAGTDWTVAETAAHVSCVLTGLSATIAGELPALTSTRMRTSRPGWRPPTPPASRWLTRPTRDGSRR